MSPKGLEEWVIVQKEKKIVNVAIIVMIGKCEKMIESYPLYWPPGWPRRERRESARFNTTRGNAISQLLNELRLMGAKGVVISSNLQTYFRAGQERPYANQNVDDPAVAVYFDYNGGQQCIPCDRWADVSDNIQAINKTVSALRGLERWGAKEMVDAAFKGFVALPEKTGGIDHFEDLNTRDDVVARFRALAKEMHPDGGGTETEFNDLREQYQVKLQTVE